MLMAWIFRPYQSNASVSHFPDALNMESTELSWWFGVHIKLKSCVLVIIVIPQWCVNQRRMYLKNGHPRAELTSKVIHFVTDTIFSNCRNARFYFFLQTLQQKWYVTHTGKGQNWGQFSLVQVVLYDLSSKTCENDRSGYKQASVIAVELST
jgi:hypothetical protein